MISFLSKLFWKILFSRTLVSLSVLHTNSKPLVKNSESPPIRVLFCSRSHTSLKTYKLFYNHSKRSIVQVYLLGVEKRCIWKLSSWCREELYRFDKCYFVKWCIRSWFWVYKIRIRKISSGLLRNWTQVTRNEPG